MSLGEFVKRRNGVPLGASGSLTSMLKRSFGANSFDNFWHYWNPIWAYYLSNYVMRPTANIFPAALAVVITFVVSGALHDFAVLLLTGDSLFICTPWFFVMGIAVVISKTLTIDLSQHSFVIRATANTSAIVVSYLLSRSLLSFLGLE